MVILVIFGLIWWVFAIINIVFCVKAGIRYKKLGMKGAAKRIILSWVIIFSGIIVGGIFAGVVNSHNPMTTMAVEFCTCYLFEIIAIIYTKRASEEGASEEEIADFFNSTPERVKRATELIEQGMTKESVFQTLKSEGLTWKEVSDAYSEAYLYLKKQT